MRASKNPAIFATVLEDLAALVGLALAAAGLMLSHRFAVPAFEGVASILIGVVLMLEAGLLGYECRSLIIGEAARPIVIAEVRRIVALYPWIEPAFTVRTLQLGPEAVMLVLGLGRVPHVDAGGVDAAIHAFVAHVRSEIPVVTDIVFELGPPSRRSGDDGKLSSDRRLLPGGALHGAPREPKSGAGGSS